MKVTASILNISILLIICSLNLCAHGDLDKRITALSDLIMQFPDSAALYQSRGRLYLQHEEFELSLDDLEQAIQLGYYNINLLLDKAEAHFELKENTRGLKLLDQVLNISPHHIEALKMKGRVYMGKKKYKAAARCFESVIDNANELFPQNFIEAASAWQNVNSKKGKKKAKSLLNLCLESIGPFLSIYNQLLDLALLDNDYNEAIKYQTKILEQSKRKEFGYYRRAVIHIEYMDYEKAIQDLNHAKKEIQSLKFKYQQLPAIKKLSEQINMAILSINKQVN